MLWGLFHFTSLSKLVISVVWLLSYCIDKWRTMPVTYFLQMQSILYAVKGWSLFAPRIDIICFDVVVEELDLRNSSDLAPERRGISLVQSTIIEHRLPHESQVHQ